MITIITPTVGGKNLNKLIESIDIQSVPSTHILLWDEIRELPTVFDPYEFRSPKRYSIIIPRRTNQEYAKGSVLRSIGLMAAATTYVTFADDDVWYDQNHFEKMLQAIENKNWAYCKRRVWTKEMKYLGVDNFESVGDDSSRKVPYEMIDNSSMIFKREFGVLGANFYRETEQYNDDRLMYKFLKDNAGEPGKTGMATVNQTCPKELELMFMIGCSKEC